MINFFHQFCQKAYAIDFQLLPAPKANGSYELSDLFYIIGNIIEIALIFLFIHFSLYQDKEKWKKIDTKRLQCENNPNKE